MSGPVSDWHAICSALKRRVDSTAKELGHGVVGGTQRKLHADRERQRPLQDRVRAGGRNALERLLDGGEELEVELLDRLGDGDGHRQKYWHQLERQRRAAASGRAGRGHHAGFPMRKSPNDFAEIATQA